MVFHHEPSMLLVEELAHMTGCQGVIDLTCGAGVWALFCMEARIPYFGLTLSVTHMEDLRAHLAKEALAANIKHVDICPFAFSRYNWSLLAQVRLRMQNPTSKLYMPTYFPNPTKPPPNPKPKPPKPKPGKTSPKKKSKKNPKKDDSPAKTSSSSDSDI